MKRRAALAVFATGLLSACARSSAGIAPEPRGLRVVSLAPSTTEALFAIGAGGDVVGRSRYCDYPPEAMRLPAVGGYADPSVEAIVALQPSLVVGARGPAGPALEQALRSRSIDTYFPETESVAQITDAIVGLGRLVAKAAESTRVADAVRARIADVGRRVAGRPKRRVALLFDLAPIVAAGPGSFPAELLALAGAENVVTRGGAYPTLGLETLLALDPDVIVDAAGAAAMGASPGLASVRDRAGWRDLSAVKNDRAPSLDGSTALRPGPRVGEGLWTLARAIHGDLGP